MFREGIGGSRGRVKEFTTMVLGESAINPRARHLAAVPERRKSHDNAREARTSKHARETHYEFTGEVEGDLQINEQFCIWLKGQG